MSPYDAERLANNLIATHLGPSWRFGWNRRKRAYGTCNYRNHTIYLSGPLLPTQSNDQVRDTILHEIAHALTPGHKHDHVWRVKARLLGADPKRTAVMANPSERPQYNWLVMFDGKVIKGYYRRPKFDIHLCFIPGRKMETLGKLTLVPNTALVK